MNTKNIWVLAKQIRTKMQHAFKHYQLPEDKPEIFEGLYSKWDERIANQTFFLSNCVTNFGVVDEAFVGIDEHYPIESYYCSILERAMMLAMLIAAIGLKDKLYLNFNFCTPAFNRKIAEKLADKVVEYLCN